MIEADGNNRRLTYSLDSYDNMIWIEEYPVVMITHNVFENKDEGQYIESSKNGTVSNM